MNTPRMNIPLHLPSLNVGFVSTRIKGIDGVSLEADKWAEVFTRLGHHCCFFAGESDQPAKRDHIVPEAHFRHPDVERIYNESFSARVRDQRTTARIHELKDHLEIELRKFIRNFEIDLLVAENALTIPLNLPLGLALTELIAETGIHTIAHHHDFFWERKRFLVNCVWDYLNMAFPPHLPSIHHVVINSSAANQLALRTGISSMLIPNAMDFDHPPAPPDDYARDVRARLGVDPDAAFFLQPTRIVPRKGIEHAIELVSRVGRKSNLVVSHASGDEGYDYEQHLRGYARQLHVDVNFESDLIREHRGQTPDGRKVFSLWDVYPHADIVTYPSDIEGFGNAFLEAVYFRKPIVVNNYSIFDTDIKPKGFHVIEFNGYISQKTVQQTVDVLGNPDVISAMTEKNYRLARRHYSYTMLERHLQTLLAECFGEDCK